MRPSLDTAKDPASLLVEIPAGVALGLAWLNTLDLGIETTCPGQVAAAAVLVGADETAAWVLGNGAAFRRGCRHGFVAVVEEGKG